MLIVACPLIYIFLFESDESTVWILLLNMGNNLLVIYSFLSFFFFFLVIGNLNRGNCFS